MRNVILETDLYHLMADPNDHWNLATMYALALRKRIRFAGILCDEDKSDMKNINVDADGNLLEGADHPDGIFTYEPVWVKCAPNGILEWKDTTEETNVKMFRLRNLEAYREAMIKVEKELLSAM